jgi:hypothetical protein
VDRMQAPIPQIAKIPPSLRIVSLVCTKLVFQNVCDHQLEVGITVYLLSHIRLLPSEFVSPTPINNSEHICLVTLVWKTCGFGPGQSHVVVTSCTYRLGTPASCGWVTGAEWIPMSDERGEDESMRTRIECDILPRRAS